MRMFHYEVSSLMFNLITAAAASTSVTSTPPPPPPTFGIPPPPAPPLNSGAQTSFSGENINKLETVCANLTSDDLVRYKFLFLSKYPCPSLNKMSVNPEEAEMDLLLHLSTFLMLGCFGLLLSFSIIVCTFRLCYCQRSFPSLLSNSSSSRELSDLLIESEELEQVKVEQELTGEGSSESCNQSKANSSNSQVDRKSRKSFVSTTRDKIFSLKDKFFPSHGQRVFLGAKPLPSPTRNPDFYCNTPTASLAETNHI